MKTYNQQLARTARALQRVGFTNGGSCHEARADGCHPARNSSGGGCHGRSSGGCH